MHYTGWIPTITGHLSFTTIATGSFPTRCWRRDDGKRFLAVQRRDLLDVLVPYADSLEVMSFFREKIANLVVGISGRFWYILDAQETCDGEGLTGVVHMVPQAKNKSYVAKLKKFFAAGRDDSDISSIVSLSSSVSCYSVSFTIERKGKVCLSPLGTDCGSELDKLLANQVFYFLKDISHVHQHHHPSHDAITQISRIAGAVDAQAWIAKTQFDLYRAIIRFKRFKNEKALFRAAGILAYAQSFDRAYGDVSSPAKKFHVVELKESLAIGREEIAHFQSKALSLSETVRGFFFAAFGLVAATGIFARLGGAQKIEVDQSLISIAHYVASSPWTTVGVTALLSLTWAFVTHRIDPSEFRLVRIFLRLIQGYRLRWTFAFHVMVTLALICISYLFLR